MSVKRFIGWLMLFIFNFLCVFTGTAQLDCNNAIGYYIIKFPADANANCNEAINSIQSFGDSVSISITDAPFSPTGDECYRIRRTFSVINWCEYNGNDDPFVISRDVDCNSIQGDRDIYVIVNVNSLTYLDADADTSNINPLNSTMGTACTGFSNPNGFWYNSAMDNNIDSKGYWQYTQFIKVYDQQAPFPLNGPADTTVHASSDIPPDMMLTAADTCSGLLSQTQMYISSPTNVIIPGVDTNHYTILRTWEFEDACNNTNSFTQEITVSIEPDIVIPTMSQWGMIILCLGLGIFGLVYARDRRFGFI